MPGPGELVSPLPTEEAAASHPARKLGERLPRWATSLSAKYAVAFALLVAVPVIGTSAYLLDSFYNQSRRALIRLQQEKAKSLALTVEQALDAQASRLGSFQLTGLSNSQRALLLRPVLLSANILAVSYIDSAGRELTRLHRVHAPTPSHANFAHRRLFEEARAKGVFFSPVLRSDELAGALYEGGPISPMEIAVAENSGGGVVRESLDPAGAFRDVIVGTHLGRSGYAYAVDTGGRPVAHRTLRSYTPSRQAGSQT